MSDPDFSTIPLQIDIDDVPMTTANIDRLYQDASTRALNLLKSKLGWKRIMELLTPEIETSTQNWREWLATSGDKLTAEAVYFDVHGIELEDFLAWYSQHLGQEDFQWYMHPEHYVWGVIDEDLGDFKAGSQIVVEPWGSMVAATPLKIVNSDDPDEFDDLGHRDDSYPFRWAGAGIAPDGTLAGTIYYQFKPTSSGFRMKCANSRPSDGIPDDILTGMREHLILEWSKTFQLAKLEIDRGRHAGMSNEAEVPSQVPVL